jgi:hypothetical protein
MKKSEKETIDKINAAVQKQDWRNLCDILNTSPGSLYRPYLQVRDDDEEQILSAILDELLYRNMFEPVGEMLKHGVSDAQFSTVISQVGKGSLSREQLPFSGVINTFGSRVNQIRGNLLHCENSEARE